MMRHLTPLAAAAVLLFAGAWRVSSDPATNLEGYGLFILGSAVLGAWIALHSRGDGS